MAGTLSTKKPRPSTTESGRPNMYLSAVRQSALRLAEKRWKGLEKPKTETTAAEFTTSLEWTNICRLHFELSGFNFTGEGPKGKPGKDISDGKIVDVAVLLAEVEPSPAAEAKLLTPIQWDEVDLTAAPVHNDEARPASTVLELYEPPEKTKAATREAKEKKVEPPAAPPPPTRAAEIILDAVPEEPPYAPPPMAGPLTYAKPELRKPPATPSQAHADPLAAPGSRLHMPSVTVLPMRQAMVAGPTPEALAAPKPPVEAPAPAPVEAKAADVAPETKPETKPEPKAEPKAEVKTEVKAAAPAARAEAPQQGRKKKKHQKGANRGPVEESIEEPDDLGDDVEAEISASRKTVEEPAPAPSRKAEPPAPTPAKIEETDIQFSFGGMANAPIEAPKSASLSLGLSSEEAPLPAPAGMSGGMKAGIAVAVLGVAGAVGFLTMGGSSSKEPAKPAAMVSVMETAGTVMGEAGWSTDFTTDASGRRVRQLSLYRPSMQITDYRIEFQAEIEYKAVGWAVRAANPKSYWALKLFQEGGKVKLRRFSVTDSKDGSPTDSAMPFSTNAGMMFKVRTDVVGKKFVVSVNDQKIDEWEDTQIALGGFGVANEGAERGQVRSIQVWHLRERKVAK